MSSDRVLCSAIGTYTYYYAVCREFQIPTIGIWVVKLQFWKMESAIKQLVLQLNWFPLNKSQFEQILLQFFLPKPSFVLNTYYWACFSGIKIFLPDSTRLGTFWTKMLASYLEIPNTILKPKVKTYQTKAWIHLSLTDVGRTVC